MYKYNDYNKEWSSRKNKFTIWPKRDKNGNIFLNWTIRKDFRMLSIWFTAQPGWFSLRCSLNCIGVIPVTLRKASINVHRLSWSPTSVASTCRVSLFRTSAGFENIPVTSITRYLFTRSLKCLLCSFIALERYSRLVFQLFGSYAQLDVIVCNYLRHSSQWIKQS